MYIYFHSEPRINPAVRGPRAYAFLEIISLVASVLIIDIVFQWCLTNPQ